MVLGFSWLPPEINSARMFAGAGSGPLFAAASAWEGLAADLWASASSFESVLAGVDDWAVDRSGVDVDGCCRVSVCRVVEHGGVAGAAGGHSGSRGSDGV